MTVYNLLTKNSEDIREALQRQQALLDALKEENIEALVLDRCVVDCPYRRKLKTILLETVQVLEGTRRAFKSRQLEMLRKKLTQTLAGID